MVRRFIHSIALRKRHRDMATLYDLQHGKQIQSMDSNASGSQKQRTLRYPALPAAKTGRSLPDRVQSQ
jgi:hypothetical protein